MFRYVEDNSRDFARSDMNYDEFKDLCTEAWKDEEYTYFYNEKSKQGGEVKCSIVTEVHQKHKLNVYQ